MNRIMKNLFIKISISRCISELEDLDLLYHDRRSGKYLVQSRSFFGTLQAQSDIFFTNLPAFSAEYNQHISAMELSLNQQNIEEIHRQQLMIDKFLNKVYSSISVRSKKFIRTLSIACQLLLILALLAFAYKPLKEKYNKELAKDDLLRNEETYKAQTISDLLNLKRALQQYYADNKQYPNTSSAWYGIISPFGVAKEDWIPGLVPKYIPSLPHDPRKFRQPMEQYMYQSNGKDYKLIAHFPIGIDDAIKQHPDMVDARRPSWAIGVWTEEAKNW